MKGGSGGEKGDGKEKRGKVGKGPGRVKIRDTKRRRGLF